MRHTHRFALVAAALVASALLSAATHAAPINHGTYMGDDVWFIDVTEDSGTDPGSLPLYGAPTVSGNSIDFSPTGFNAFADDSGQTDTTDGALSFMLQAKDNHYIQTVQMSEAGDTSLSGFSGEAFSSVTATVFIDIMEVDGAPISAINVGPANLVFAPSGGDYFLSIDGGGGPVYGTAWTGSLSVDIMQALIDANQEFEHGVTKLTVTMDNTLVAISEEGTEAFIAKKDVDGLSITPEIMDIPEPTGALLMLVGIVSVGLTRRRRGH